METEPRNASARPLVLIVEDDLGTRAVYRDVLSHAGFRTADAHNGHQALEKARVLQPDLVVTDLAVPGMDGFEFSRALQGSELTRAIPVLAVTGHPEYLAEPDRFTQAGISRVLTKPCEPDVMVEELRRLLRRPQGYPAPAGSTGAEKVRRR
jgi:two-component system, cell cycle response regulator DivK